MSTFYNQVFDSLPIWSSVGVSTFMTKFQNVYLYDQVLECPPLTK